MSHRWTFYDPITLAEEEIFLNPQEMRLPDLEKSIDLSSTAAPDGRLILTEGVDRPQTLGFVGVTLTLAQLNWLETQFNKRYQVRMTDDFDREWWIYIYKLTRTRPRTRPSHPEFHRYTMDAYVLDWPEPE